MVPAPVMNGTVTFFSIALVLMVATVFGRLVGCVSKDMTYVALVLYPLAAFCSWLLWVCCWMHQWHPLVYPIYPQEE